LQNVGLIFFDLIPLIFAQRAINFNNKQIVPDYQPLKKFTRVEIIFIILGSLLWLVGIQRAIFKPEIAKDPIAHVTSWITFQPSSKAFEVQFPTYPTYRKKNITIPETELRIDYENYASRNTDKTVYSIGCSTYPPEIAVNQLNPDTFLADILESSLGNKLINSESKYFGKYKALDFLVLEQGYYIKGRIIIVGQTVYILMNTYQGSRYNETDYNKFINSFSLN
jgi:hypothetical protein